MQKKMCEKERNAILATIQNYRNNEFANDSTKCPMCIYYEKKSLKKNIYGIFKCDICIVKKIAIQKQWTKTNHVFKGKYYCLYDQSPYYNLRMHLSNDFNIDKNCKTCQKLTNKIIELLEAEL